MNINVQRVASRVADGGHSVPEAKIRSRYYKSLLQLPRLVGLSDVIYIYDNTLIPFRIYKKKRTEELFWENEVWNTRAIKEVVINGELTGW